MSIIPQENLMQLISERAEPTLTIYMPTYRTGKEVEQNTIRFKNLVSKAEEELKKYEFDNKDVDQFLTPLKNMIDDDYFWQHQSDGLALYRSKNQYLYFRIPYQFDESIIVQNHFYLKPLLPLLSHDGQYFVLALDLKALKFYQATRFRIHELELKDVPESIDEALKYDDFERQFQFHTEAPGAGGERHGIFHGQGVGTDEAQKKKYIYQYFHMVENGISKIISSESAPMVLAGQEHLSAMYREINKYPHLIENDIKKDPKAMNEDELRQLSWEAVEPQFLQNQQEVIEKYQNEIETGLSSSNLEEIVPAAFEGRIESLILDTSFEKWGKFSESDFQITINKEKKTGDIDLVDFAAVHTLLKNGKVYGFTSEELPVKEKIAAVFRY